MRLGDRTAQRHQTIARTAVVSSDYADFKTGQRVLTREGFPGVVTAVSDGPVPGNEEYEVTLDGGLGGGAYAPGELRPLDPSVAAEAALQVEAAGWRRFTHGEFADGWISSDGNIILEKGAPGEGAESRGIWTWIIWLKADPSEYTVDQFGAYSNSTSWSGPLRKVGDDWYVDTGFEGWGLDDAKANAAHVLERRGHTAAVTEAAVEADVRTAADDYPELGNILEERPDHEHVIPVTAARIDVPGEGNGPPKTYFENLGDVMDHFGRAPDRCACGKDVIWDEGDEVYLHIDYNTPVNDWTVVPEGRHGDEHHVGRKLIPVTDESEISRPGFGVEASWFSDHATDYINQHTPTDFRTDPEHAYSVDWCRFRRNSRCFFSHNVDEAATEQAGYVVWTPEDRGFCPRNTWDSQRACPIGEPGPLSGAPNAGPEATVSWEQGGQRFSALDDDREFGFHLTAAWRDVRAKAKRIKTEGGVRIIAAPTETDTTVTAEVKGDHHIYETTIMREPGRHAVAMWTCGCAWASYSWGRSGRWKRYEGRMCSHALALVYEVQAKGMFGKTILEDRVKPEWRMDPTIPVMQPQNYPKPKKRSASLQVVAHAPGDQVEIRLPDDHPLMGTKWWPTSPHYDGRQRHTKVTGTVQRVFKNGNVAVAIHQMPNYGDSGDQMRTQHVEAEHLYPLHESSLRPVCTDGDLEIAPAVLIAQGMLSQGYSPNETLETLIDMGLPNAVGMISEALSVKPFKAKVRGWVRKIVQIVNGNAVTETGEEVPLSQVYYPTYDPRLGLDPSLRDSKPHIAARWTSYDGRALFHGTAAELKPGDTIEPAGVRGTPSRFSEHDYYDPYKIYLSDQAHLAGRYAYGAARHGGGEPHVYLVRPIGSVYRDPEFESGFGGDQWVSDLAEVKAEVPREQWADQRYERLGSGADTKGVMVCFRLPDKLAHTLAELGTEDVSNIHITLAYFGKPDEIDPDQLRAAVRSFADTAPTLLAEVSGLGTFENGEENVLVATWDIPGIDRFRSDLVTHCEDFGQIPYSNHGFTPHATLSYGDKPFRTLPKLPDGVKERFAISDIWLTIGDEWEHFPLTPLGATTADLASDWAEALTEGYESGEVDADAITWFAPSDAGQALGERGAFSSRIQFHVNGVSEDVEEAADLAQSMVRSNGGEDVTIERESLSGDVTIATANDMSAWWAVDGAERMTNIPGIDPGSFAFEAAAHGIEPPEAELHDEPEPALPETDGADEDDEIKPGDSKLGWLMGGEGGQDKSNSDIAAMARQFLKEGAKAFTPAEQRQIIDEGEGVLATNFDSLDITGTHYEALEAALAAEEDDEELLFG